MTTPTSTLESIVKRLSADPTDEVAWAELYRQLWPFVFAVAYRRLRGTRALAEDAAQEVFLRLVRARPFSSLADEHALRAYVWRVAENTATDYLRRALERQAVEPALEDFGEGQIDVPAPATEREGTLELRDLLEEARHALPLVDQQILTLVIEGRDLSEIARATGLSYTNVGVRLHRLRKRLRKFLIAGNLVALNRGM